MEIYANEPKLEELRAIRKSLYASESTDINVKKIKAVETQIARHEAVAEAKKVAAKKEADALKAAEKVAEKREEKAKKERKPRN